MKKRLVLHLITLVSTILFVIFQLLDPSVIREHIESKTYDLRLNMRNLVKQQSPLQDIIIVVVDEKSVKEIGRWPWRRDMMAVLINKISSGEPKVIGIDIMFLEPETESTDTSLAQAIKEAGNVVLAVPFLMEGDEKKAKSSGEPLGYLWDSAFMEVRSQKGVRWKDWVIRAKGVIPPLEQLAAVSTLGHANTLRDMDGVIRWEALYLLYGDDYYPHFSLQIARIALDIPKKDMVLYGGTGVTLGNRFISTDLSGRVRINYLGREDSFPHLSASDVMNGLIDPKTLKDRIVFVGTSAMGTYDQMITPFSVDVPGVEKNANVLENILSNRFIKVSPGILELVAIVFTGIFLGLILPRLKAISGSLLAAGLIVFYALLSFYLLAYRDILINLLYPVMNMFGIFTFQTVYRFLQEERKARKIQQIFSRYVSPKIVKVLIDNPEKTELGGERREVTVLFSDIIGFTTLMEKKRPEEVISMLNEYFQEMTDIIFRWDGTVDKFVGDQIMAFWGAPVEQQNHAELAVRCALNMSDRLTALQKEWRGRGVEGINCGIGINTGEVLIGNIGAKQKMDYTVIGDPINLAARVEKMTRQYNTRVLITEQTFQHIATLVRNGQLGHCEKGDLVHVKVKGKEEEIRIFKLIGVPHSEAEQPMV
jgi:adenylate cyclase